MGAIKHAAILFGMVLTLGVSALHPSVVQAQSMSGNPMVTGNIIRDFARITFYWPEKIDMSATTSGNKLVVRFDRVVNPDFGEILRSMYPYIVKAELTGNQRTIIFTMKQPYKIRSFITDSESGVDILGIYDPSAPEPAKPAPPQTQQAKAAPAPVKPAPQPRAEEPARTLPPQSNEDKRRAVPVVDVKEAALTPPPQQAAKPKRQPDINIPAPAPAVATPAKAPEPAPKTAPEAEAAKAAEPAPAPAPVTTPPAQTASVPTAQPVALPAATMQPLSNFGRISGKRVDTTLEMIDKQPTIRFGFEERVAAAAWQRERTVMLWFAKPYSIAGLQNILQRSSSWLTNIRQLGGEDFTLLQLDLLTDVQLKLFKDREGYGWQVQVLSSPEKPEHMIPAHIVTSTKPAHVFMPVTQAENAVTITDPQVGDILTIVPLYASGTGVYPPRSFVDFDILTTSQGIVISPQSDNVRITKQADGVRISAQEGLSLTESITAEDAANAGTWDRRDQLFKFSLFPYRDWKVENMRDLHEREAYLLHQITNAPDERTRNQNRQQLAQLYLGQNMYNEANAVLNRIRREDLDYYREHKLAALEGASYLLNYRLPEAALSLSSDTLDNNEEGELLRKATQAAMGADAEKVPYMQYNFTYIRQYPPKLRQRLAIIAANHAIQKGDLRTPTEIFETLEEDKLSGDIKHYVDFLKAKVSAASGRAKDAEKIWEAQAQMDNDRQFRARSEYSLVLLELEEGTITPEEAIKRLDALRIVWRGDDLERSLLMVVGQLNVNVGNYWDGMKAWEELLEYYPNSPDAMEAYQRLASTFRNLFLEDAADKIDQVKALALYSEFQELTPLGADGNRMLQKLVDRLVDIDLLEQAAARLENLIEYRLENEEKSRVGARLAIIYLLNREPAKAIEALQKSRVDNVPPSLSLERNRIAAQALIDLNRPEQALTMIEGDFSADGENLRLEAYWAKEDWAYAIDIIELLLRERPDLNAPFNEAEGQKLLQLALAYIFVGEFDQLQYIRDAYAPLMENNPYKEEFMFLTEKRIETNSENFSKVIDSIGSMQSFMNGYRERLKQGGLSETVANEKNDETDAKAPANPQ